ncbi:MAG: ABC transporter substrate-binding protein [Magnetococcales bacterium]|nr:ABC transporter substrate-binding protein [Magnetococcales bacterium]NGZ05782.1 ABC transporter substrate-binding protein [Magnetococcales bacterium]
MRSARLIWLFSLLTLWIMPGVGQTTPPSPAIKTVISVVGPRNLSYLPVDLIPILGADRAEGLEIQLKHVEGGGIAIKEMISRNSDFTVVGFPALMSLKANGGELVGIAAVSDVPQFVLIVRQELRDQVKRIADLKGRIIGVNTSAVNAKTVAQQLLELLLRSDGLQPHDARVISTGQEWNKRIAMLNSGQVDAIMSEEPFASTLLTQNKVFFLANLAEPESTRHIPGARVLHAALATRPDVVQREPDKVKRVVAALQRSLRWIATHTPEELLDRLALLPSEEQTQLLLCLKKYPRLFSPDGAFSQKQITETNRFFHAGNPETLHIRMEDLINAQWAGRKE